MHKNDNKTMIDRQILHAAWLDYPCWLEYQLTTHTTFDTTHNTRTPVAPFTNFNPSMDK